MNYIFYTTSSSSWYRSQLDVFARAISQTKGRGEVTIDIKRSVPDNPPIIVDQDGDKRFPWDWVQTHYPKGEYDGVIVHFTPYYRSKWGMTKSINGAKNTLNKEYPEFWVCCNAKEKAQGYEFEQVYDGENFHQMNELLRLLFHEHAHFDEDLDDKVGNLLIQESVHFADYEKKQIHIFHNLVDYRGKKLQELVNKLTMTVLKLVKKLI